MALLSGTCFIERKPLTLFAYHVGSFGDLVLCNGKIQLKLIKRESVSICSEQKAGNLAPTGDKCIIHACVSPICLFTTLLSMALI